MKINSDDTISAIRKAFNDVFPFLQIEFFSEPYHIEGTFLVKNIQHYNKTLNDCRIVRTKNQVTVSPEMTVFDLDQLFRENYGLGVQVFRKSGKAWLETTVTEGWTLEEQNRQGEALSL